MPLAHDEHPRLSGAILVDNLRTLREIAGDQAVCAGLDALDAGTRVSFSSATTLTWVPAPEFERFFTAAASSVGRNRDALQDEVSRRAIERTLSTLWRVILRVTTDNALISRTPLLYSKTFDAGEMQSHIDAPGRAEVLLLGWPSVSDFHARGIARGIETVLRCSGRKAARVTWARRGTGAAYQATWDP